MFRDSQIAVATSRELSCTFEKTQNRHRENAIAFSVKRMAESAIGDSEMAIGVSESAIGDSECIVYDSVFYVYDSKRIVWKNISHACGEKCENKCKCPRFLLFPHFF